MPDANARQINAGRLTTGHDFPLRSADNYNVLLLVAPRNATGCVSRFEFSAALRQPGRGYSRLARLVRLLTASVYLRNPHGKLKCHRYIGRLFPPSLFRQSNHPWINSEIYGYSKSLAR